MDWRFLDVHYNQFSDLSLLYDWRLLLRHYSRSKSSVLLSPAHWSFGFRGFRRFQHFRLRRWRQLSSYKSYKCFLLQRKASVFISRKRSHTPSAFRSIFKHFRVAIFPSTARQFRRRRISSNTESFLSLIISASSLDEIFSMHMNAYCVAVLVS